MQHTGAKESRWLKRAASEPSKLLPRDHLRRPRHLEFGTDPKQPILGGEFRAANVVLRLVPPVRASRQRSFRRRRPRVPVYDLLYLPDRSDRRRPSAAPQRSRCGRQRELVAGGRPTGQVQSGRTAVGSFRLTAATRLRR